MLSEHEKLEQKINSIKNQLENQPPGKLVLSHNGKAYKWYQSDGPTKTYIPKKEQKLAESLAVKKYLTLSLEELEKEKRAIEAYLTHPDSTCRSEQLHTQSSEYQNL